MRRSSWRKLVGTSRNGVGGSTRSWITAKTGTRPSLSWSPGLSRSGVSHVRVLGLAKAGTPARSRRSESWSPGFSRSGFGDLRLFGPANRVASSQPYRGRRSGDTGGLDSGRSASCGRCRRGAGSLPACRAHAPGWKESRAPMLGPPGTCEPVMKNVTPGAWLTASVYRLRPPDLREFDLGPNPRAWPGPRSSRRAADWLPERCTRLR